MLLLLPPRYPAKPIEKKNRRSIVVVPVGIRCVGCTTPCQILTKLPQTRRQTQSTTSNPFVSIVCAHHRGAIFRGVIASLAAAVATCGPNLVAGQRSGSGMAAFLVPALVATLNMRMDGILFSVNRPECAQCARHLPLLLFMLLA